jgi:hypothetical protein
MHAAPHAPQFALSVLKLRQSAPHSVLPVMHVVLAPPPLAPLPPEEAPTAGAPPALPPNPAVIGPEFVPALLPPPPVVGSSWVAGPAELAQPMATKPTPRTIDTQLNTRVWLSIFWLCRSGDELRRFVNLMPETQRSRPRTRSNNARWRLVRQGDRAHALQREHYSST